MLEVRGIGENRAKAGIGAPLIAPSFFHTNQSLHPSPVLLHPRPRDTPQLHVPHFLTPSTANLHPFPAQPHTSPWASFKTLPVCEALFPPLSDLEAARSVTATHSHYRCRSAVRTEGQTLGGGSGGLGLPPQPAGWCPQANHAPPWACVLLSKMNQLD